jgi:ATP-binding cassette subfamily B protein
MVPTHELAIQVAAVFESIAHKTKVKALCIFGGVEQNPQIQSLYKGVDIVIATPGRMFDLIHQGALDISKIKYLIFDEATSALDSLTEEIITNTIQNISAQKNHIVILIAHRLSTIMHADKIFVLEKGKIIEEGNHRDLLTEKGLYSAMWRQQIGERK